MPENVMIYSLSTCSHCNATKRLLSECKVEYVFKDVDLLSNEERKAVLEDIRNFNPECSFPTIIIGKKVIVGYNEKEILDALGMPRSKKSVFEAVRTLFRKG